MMNAQLPQAGAVIDGKYRVESILGRGGMGLIVAARHLRLGHLVAIKFPLPSAMSNSNVVDRLLREARAVMRLESDHVARVHDIGIHEGVGPFLVMEYLRGTDLGATLRSGALPVSTATEYVLQACEALVEAHAKGIIHRDLKPSNLFLSQRPDGSLRLKVIDFGLAKNVEIEPWLPLTASGAMLGSPWFMAPEQMRGAPTDQRADIWGLGATFYALLTGYPPFPGNNLLDVYDNVLAGPPSLNANCPDAGAALDAVLRRCLQARPADRYASISEFAEALGEASAVDVKCRVLLVRRIADAAGLPEVEHASEDGPATLASTTTIAPKEPSWNVTPPPASIAPSSVTQKVTAVWPVAVASLSVFVALGITLVLLALAESKRNGTLSGRREAVSAHAFGRDIGASTPSLSPSVRPVTSALATALPADATTPRAGSRRRSRASVALPVADPLASPD